MLEALLSTNRLGPGGGEPGASEPIHGDDTYGFYGEVLNPDLPSGMELRQLVGLNGFGTERNPYSKWVKFALDGKKLYFPLQPLYYNISWDKIHSVGAVFGKEIVWGGRRFKVRLFKGSSSDPTALGQFNDPTQTPTSEWNRLMYPIHDTHPGGAPNWANYANLELGVSWTGSPIDFFATWCQESRSGFAQAVHRGYNGIAHYNYNSKGTGGTPMCWRPILELVE